MIEPPEMVGWTEKLLDRGRQQHDALTERLFKQGSVLSTWLVVGNAGALAFSAKALIDGGPCVVDALRLSALAFAVGLLLTVSGMMIGFISTSAMALKLSELMDQIQGAWISEVHIAALERNKVDVAADAPLRLSQAAYEAKAKQIHDSSRRVAKLGISISSAITLLGCVAFGVGLLHPFVTGKPFGACQAEVRETSPTPSYTSASEPSQQVQQPVPLQRPATPPEIPSEP